MSETEQIPQKWFGFSAEAFQEAKAGCYNDGHHPPSNRRLVYLFEQDRKLLAATHFGETLDDILDLKNEIADLKIFGPGVAAGSKGLLEMHDLRAEQAMRNTRKWLAPQQP